MGSISFATYQGGTTYGQEYADVRDFLIELDSHNYTFGRWDWMIMSLASDWADPDGVHKIGIWRENGKIAGIATYDTKLGSAYLLALDDYQALKGEMLDYARENLGKNGAFSVLILDGDERLQDIASQRGFRPTQDKECDAIYPINQANIHYTLPDGFQIVSLKDEYDLYKYGQVLWKGFDHEVNAEGPFSFYWEKHKQKYMQEWDRPNVNLDLKVFVKAPCGDFVAHCGMWYDPGCGSALVEPVATEPAYRKMGLGRAAVLEAIRRCGELGAKRVFVGSSQQFYYNIGFRPYAASTWWR